MLIKKLIRKLSFTRHHAPPTTTPYSPLLPDLKSPPLATPSRSPHHQIPAGHFPVDVGPLGYPAQRFIVNADLLRHPIFVLLLDCSALEYGYEQQGVLRIPVNVDVFERVVESVRLGEDPELLEGLFGF